MKIITFANEPFKRIALNWAKHIEALDIENYLVYALDEETYIFLREHEINTELKDDIWSPTEENPGWIDRFEFVYSLLKSGEDILQSDIDAIWLKNPLEFITESCDIVGSIGDKLSKDIARRIGVMPICMGWTYFKSNENVLNLYNTVIQRWYSKTLINDKGLTLTRFCDQRALNIVLFENIKKKDIDHCENGIKCCESKGVRVRLLPETIIRRGKYLEIKPYVDHYKISWSSRSVPKDREMLLKDMGLWILD